MRFPKCPIHRVELEHTPQGWRCPVGRFYWRVRRGRVSSRPTWETGATGAEEELSETREFIKYLENLEKKTGDESLLRLYQSASPEQRRAMMDQWREFKSEGVA